MDVLGENIWIFVAMVFGAVFLLSQGLVTPVFGENRNARKRLRHRMKELVTSQDAERRLSLLREKRTYTKLESWLESLPLMEPFAALIAQSGYQYPAYRIVALSLALAVLAGTAGYVITKEYWVIAVGAVAGIVAPYFYLRNKRAKRIARIEEQLPDAVDVMIRALRAGHPFVEAVRLVANEMASPVSDEFKITFNEINYGGDVRAALLGLLQRVPSILIMALITAVLVQRETGGNLAEVLEKIATVIRGRFRFQRRVRTLSAEGRISAWVLTLTPFVLFLLISFVNPDYMPMLLESPRGGNLIGIAAVLIVVGVFWIKKILNVKV
ncbi:MAG: type II secretion system F family protein [Pseudomonadota bacterium]